MVDKLEPCAADMAAIYVRLSDDNQYIRKWARQPFDGGTAFYAAGFPTPANSEQVERADVDVLNVRAERAAGNIPTPTTDARERVKVLEEALDQAKHKLGYVTVDGMNGDNLAVTLCSHFDDGEGDEDEHGWTEAATAGCDATLKAIHAMYADVLRTALGNQEEWL